MAEREGGDRGEPGALERTARLLRTLRHLRPEQVAHRLRLQLRRRVWERRPDRVDARYRRRARALSPARFDHPGLAAVARLRAARRDREDGLAAARGALAGRFRFLGRSLELGRDVAWYRGDLDVGTRLWKTQLHEFSYAEDLARAAQETGDGSFRERLFELIDSWERVSPIGRPDFALDAWNARAVATRLVHWAVAGSILSLDPASAEGARLSSALGVHGLFLRDNLELDLQGNHLLRDAVGLVFADVLTGAAPDGLAVLEREVAAQVLDDGGHVERAPMYHAVALQDLLEVHVLLGDSAPGWLTDAVRRMAGFLERILLGDGDLPLLGDGWLGETSPTALVEAVAAHVGPPEQRPVGESGLVTLAAGPLRAVLRAGPHGPDYLLGHAHADLLSFDLSCGRRRVVTDTGTSLYDPGPERDRLRSTAAHNTLAIDGREQLEVWGSFRAGRRGRARLRACGESGGLRFAWAGHDAYRWLPGRPMHERLLVIGEDLVIVLDAVVGRGTHAIASRLHLHPDRPEALSVQALAAGVREEPAPLGERFGESRPMTRLASEGRHALPWVGGWLLRFGEDAAAPLESHVRLRGWVVELRCGEEPDLALDWDLRAAPPEAGVTRLRYSPRPA